MLRLSVKYFIWTFHHLHDTCIVKLNFAVVGLYCSGLHHHRFEGCWLAQQRTRMCVSHRVPDTDMPLCQYLLSDYRD